MRYRSKVFVFADAADSICAELARQIARRHHKLVLAATACDALERLAHACRALGAQVITAPASATVEADRRQLIERAVEAFGRIDVLVVRASAPAQARGADPSDGARFERLWRAHSAGVLACARSALPCLRAMPGKPGGRIVALASPPGGGAAAGTSRRQHRSALIELVDALRSEAERQGVGVTFVDTGAARSESDCARLIIGAIRARRREFVIGRRHLVGLWLKSILPRAMARITRTAVAGNAEEIDERTRFPAGR